MPREYATEPRDLAHAIRRFFTPSGLLPFILLLLTGPFIVFDDLLTVNTGYATLRAVNGTETVWGGFCLFLSVAGIVAWWLRSLGMQVLALLLQSTFFVAIAVAIARSAPHSLGCAIYGGIGAWGFLYIGLLVRGTPPGARG